MPYKWEEYLEGPRNWSEAMVGHRRWATRKVYYPIPRESLKIRIDGIVQNLDAGLVIPANQCLASLALDIDQEPRLLFNITSAQKEIQQSVTEAEAFVKTQKLIEGLNEEVKDVFTEISVKTQDIVEAFEQKLELKKAEWSQEVKQIKEYLAGTPCAYFDLSSSIVKILDDYYHEDYEERTHGEKLEEVYLIIGVDEGRVLSKIFEEYEIKKQGHTFDEVDVIDAYTHLVAKLAEWLSHFVGTAELNKQFFFAEAKIKSKRRDK